MLAAPTLSRTWSSEMCTWSRVTGGNPGDLLAVEQDEAAGDTVAGLKRVVMKEPVNESPAGVLVHCGTDTWEGRHDDEVSSEPALFEPVQEVTDSIR